MTTMQTEPTELQRFHDFCRRGTEDLVLESIAAHPEFVSAVGNLGYTAVHYASRGGHANILQHLVAAGADVNTVTSANETALHLASWHDNYDCAYYLVEAGVNKDALNNEGKKASDLARGDNMKLLLPGVDASQFIMASDDEDEDSD